jgi:putative nucleotidyltransferase with HDIG domain
VLAIGLRLLILLVPIVVSLATTAALRSVIPQPHGPALRLVWIGGLLLCAVGVALGVERGGRRLLPLVTLLKLSMLFPDQAPSRFAIARSAGSVRKLEARLAEAERDPVSSDETRTASMVLALSVALQSHDRRTRGHAERVRVYTDLLGEELDLSEADRYLLRWAALLHDIGKLTIAARILNKPGALNDAEWGLMKQHPSEGARIAAPLLEWLGSWGHAIVEHHERFDGKGYPSGVGGDAISSAGRIVAVADSYDTMTAARSYKKPMAVWAARRELADCAGGQFDPEMVRAFLSISLPRLLWKTGPVSLLVQLPFLARLQQVGLESVTAMTQGVAVATVAAGVTAMAVGGPINVAHDPIRTTGGVVTAQSSPVPEPGGGSDPADPTSTPTVPTSEPSTPTSPSSDPTSVPATTPSTPPESPVPDPSPTTLPPLPSPTTLPPLPSPTTLPPLPSPTTLPPLPSPTTLPPLPSPLDGSPQR